MGGLKWRVGDGSNVEDHRFDPPAVHAVADAVDGPSMTPRCGQCKGGLVPEVMVVQILNAMTAPAVALSCAACHVTLSAASVRTLNHERLTVVSYE